MRYAFVVTYRDGYSLSRLRRVRGASRSGCCQWRHRYVGDPSVVIYLVAGFCAKVEAVVGAVWFSLCQGKAKNTLKAEITHLAAIFSGLTRHIRRSTAVIVEDPTRLAAIGRLSCLMSSIVFTGNISRPL